MSARVATPIKPKAAAAVATRGPARSPTSRLAMSARKTATASTPSHHVLELLAPLDPAIPSRAGHAITDHSVVLQRTTDDWLELVFPELSRPGEIVAMELACVNKADGCRCQFARLLRNVLVMMERQLLRVTARYVITSVALVGADSRASTVKVATIQLFVRLHERIGRVSTTTMQGFGLVLSHLQTSLMHADVRQRPEQIQQMLDKARESSCHVVGCDQHSLTHDPQERFTLTDVFHALTTHVDVDQMPIRDDETYLSRMKRARREIILTDLPVTALHTLVRMMDARDLASISAVCTMFQHMAYEVVPGLKLLLYSHQRKGLRWMLFREGSTRRELSAMPHPFMFPAVRQPVSANPQDEDAEAKAIDLIDGRLVKQSSVPIAADSRGGLYCDEPGLGKTITMLALILRTKGQRADTRQDAQASQYAPRPSVTLRSSESRGRQLKTRDLAISAATLIVVPNPLIDHWKFQIKAHVKRGVLKVFFDDLEAKKPMPSAEELATYDVVVTSFGRLSSEWKTGRPKSALEERRPDRYGFEDGPQRFVDGHVCRETSSLLMVHWVRIIVDEGHKLGGTQPTNHMRMARLFHADKRWVMTGTPTPNTMQSADLRHMHGLLVFLRDRPYGDIDGKAWVKAIARPFEQQERAGYVRLVQLLNRIMMRHTKESIRTLIPTPIRHTAFVDPTPKEYAMYNGIAAAVRANLVLTNMDPENPGKAHLDSLLNPINRKFAMEVTRNLREATCGGHSMVANLDEESFNETVNMLVSNNVDLPLLESVKAFMRRAKNVEFLTECVPCGRHLQLLMLLPCGHLSCADCVEARIEMTGPSCLICNASYDREVFQMLQPGFDYRVMENDWVYRDEGNGMNGNTHRPVSNQHQTTRGHAQQRGATVSTSDSIPITERDGNRQRRRPIDLARFAPVNASKAFYVARRIIELRKEFAKPQNASSENYWEVPSHRPKVVKAIIFSQFKEHVWRVKVALAQQGISCEDFIAGRTPAMRMESLYRFRNDPSRNVLVLTDIGSHGLDLSFVTHIFLMDEIWDKSLEQQVISRAHRMGARSSVVVEQLLMRGSVEEVLHFMNKRQRVATSLEQEEEKEGKGSLLVARVSQTPHANVSRAMQPFLGAGRGKSKAGGRFFRVPNIQEEKQTVQQRQLQQLLEGLRLIDNQSTAEFGVVRFKVIDENGSVVRAASLQLPQPGTPPTEPSLPTSTPPAPSPGTVRAHTTSTAQPASIPPSDMPSSAPPTISAKLVPAKKRLRVMFKEEKPVTSQSSVQADVIDLTMDKIEAPTSVKDDATAKHTGKQRRSVMSLSDFEEDEDETEDELEFEKREPVTRHFMSKSTAKAPPMSRVQKKIRSRQLPAGRDGSDSDSDWAPKSSVKCSTKRVRVSDDNLSALSGDEHA